MGKTKNSTSQIQICLIKQNIKKIKFLVSFVNHLHGACECDPAQNFLLDDKISGF